MTLSKKSYYDIGVNLTDAMFSGSYHGRQRHRSDLVGVLHRAAQRDVRVALLTGSSLDQCRETMVLARSHSHTDLQLYYTIGVHPCCVKTDFESRSLSELRELWVDASIDPRFRALGEFGLDYDRLHYADKQIQIEHFENQLKLAIDTVEVVNKPLFLHMRSAFDDFYRIMTTHLAALGPSRKYVVHSFTGTPEEMHELLKLSENCYISFNGASLRTEEGLRCVKECPLDRLLLETDAPWCDVRRTHASWPFLQNTCYKPPYESVKPEKLDKLLDNTDDVDGKFNVTVRGRNEPCFMEQVAHIVAQVREQELEIVTETVWKTSCDVFGV